MFFPDAVLDYHQLGILNNAEIELQLEQFLEVSFHNDMDRVQIITGHGYNSPRGSVIRPIALKILQNSKFVTKIEQASRGSFNVWLGKKDHE